MSKDTNESLHEFAESRQLSVEECREVVDRAIAMIGQDASAASVWRSICAMRELVLHLRMKRLPNTKTIQAEDIPPQPRTNEAVQHPQHYNEGRFEVIDVIEDWKLGFNDGNAIKYIGRHRSKGTPKQDLEKAFWYLTRELLKVHGSSPERLCELVVTCAKPTSSATDAPTTIATWGTKREPG